MYHSFIEVDQDHRVF